MINFRCPACGKAYQAPLSQAGTKILCPQCGQKIMVPNVRNQTVLGVVDVPGTAGPAGGAPPLPGPPAWMNLGAPAEPPPADVHHYTIARGGQRYGPYTEQQFQQLSHSGNIRAGDRVWVPSSRAWVAAEQLGQRPTAAPPAVPASGFPRVLIFGLVGVAAGLFLLVGVGVAVAVVWARKPAQTEQVAQKQPEKKDELAENKKEAIKPAPTTPVEDKTKAPEKEPTVEEVVARSEKSVALIRTATGSGTGFVVAPNLLATNAHVIRDNFTKEIKVYFPSAGEAGKKPRDIQRVVHYDARRDLALIDVATEHPPLTLERGGVARGQEVLAIGNPGVGGVLSLENAVSKGVYSTTLNLPPDGTVLQMSISINPGNSGGPILSRRGKVVGVVTSKARREEGIAFAIPAADVITVVDRVKDLSPADRGKVAARYDARMVLIRTLPAAKAYQKHVALLAKQWGDAVGKGQPFTAEDARQLRNAVDEVHRKSNPTAAADLRDGRLTMRLFARDDVRAIMTDVGTDERLPDDLRRNLTELWTVYNQLRNDYHGPIGTYAEYSGRNRDAILKLERLEETLRISLGVTEQELR